jgi:hypothetical protein
MIVVNIFGAPGDGKSTTAALIFGALKHRSVKAELVTEAAKDWVWADAGSPLGWQPLLFGEQSWRVERLAGKVDVVVTDSPVLLCSLFAPPLVHPAFHDLVLWAHRRHPSVNLRVRRPPWRGFEKVGRKHTEKQSDALGENLDRLLSGSGVVPVEMASDAMAVPKALRHILPLLPERKDA